MKHRALSTRKIVITVILALLAIVACLLVWVFLKAGSGMVPVLATIRVSQVVIEPIAKVKVDQKTEVNEEILGADVRGTCHTTGDVHIALTPNPTEAAFELILIGESVSDTIGTHGPAQITSHGVTKYKAVKCVNFNGKRFTTTPAKVTADTDLTIENIASTEPGLRGRIVKRVATREVHKAYQESRRIAAQRVIHLVSEGFDATVRKHLEKLNRDLKLKRLLDNHLSDHEDLTMRLKTTEDCLHVSFLAKAGDPEQTPDFSVGSDQAVQVGLNLLGLVQNPMTTVKTIRLLYKTRKAQDSNDKAPKGKTLLGANDERLGIVTVGTQEGWIVIHFAEEEKVEKQTLKKASPDA